MEDQNRNSPLDNLKVEDPGGMNSQIPSIRAAERLARKRLERFLSWLFIIDFLGKWRYSLSLSLYVMLQRWQMVELLLIFSSFLGKWWICCSSSLVDPFGFGSKVFKATQWKIHLVGDRDNEEREVKK
jgi:hypothetical protein